jgi:nucleotide-binding universal stress UspA family protein
MGSVAERVVQLATLPVITVRPLPDRVSPEQPVARILFPTDFSDASRQAWPWARTLAEVTGADVDLVHIMLEVVPDRHMDPAFLASMATAIRVDAEKSVARFLASAGLPRERIHVHLLHGVEDAEIVRRARDGRADLIAMGTHGHTGVIRLALGSVARRLLHAAPCPVLTIGPRAYGAGGHGRPDTH